MNCVCQEDVEVVRKIGLELHVNLVTDTNRDTLNGFNLDWSTDATAAERTLEKLQTSEKHLKPEKGRGSISFCSPFGHCAS